MNNREESRKKLSKIKLHIDLMSNLEQEWLSLCLLKLRLLIRTQLWLGHTATISLSKALHLPSHALVYE